MVSLCLFQHVAAAGFVVRDGGLFENYNEMCQALIGDYLCNAREGKITKEIFPIHANRRAGEAQFVGSFLKANQVGTLEVGTHHIAQPRDGDFLFVVQAHHCETGSRAIGGIVLPYISITHRWFLYKIFRTTGNKLWNMIYSDFIQTMDIFYHIVSGSSRGRFRHFIKK